MALYVRRSTDEENQQYTSRVQEDRMRAYVASQPGWRVVMVYSDNASGKDTYRDDLAKAMKASRAGLFDVLLVFKVDRLSRNLRDLVTLLDDLDENGVVFRSATEPFDTSTPMGRMLVQMLGMFAQFERELIVERVIAGMEKAAEAGKWKGGRLPFGYGLNRKIMQLVPDKSQAVVVALIFDFYTRDRLGSNAIAKLLNLRGLRTSTGKQWSPQQVLRVLANRVYIGELTFRGITVEFCHAPLVTDHVFEQAQRLLDERGEDHSKRAANASDYLATGKMRCPMCGKAYIGTRATGRTKTYRYYTCWTRSRYGTDACPSPRLDADQIDSTLLDSMATFFRTQHDLMADAVAAAQRDHASNFDTRQDELDTVNAELAKTNAKIDRYLDAFEDGTLEPEDVKERLTKLRSTKQQLQDRRDVLAYELTEQPTMPDTATLTEVSQHVHEVIQDGTTLQRKALVEALVAQVSFPAPDRMVPTFRVPQPPDQPPQTAAEADPGDQESASAVRVSTRLVE
ncbi:recombinase family protein, partial [Actinokineospora terrae]|uniref:recombinase family protein n=1 Tax=Actinokineospora terrae TaxID=155974 RepID=UPI000B85B0B1